METTSQQTTLTLPRIGAYMPEQGGRFIGLIPGQDGQHDFGLIAPTDARALLIDVRWHDDYIDIPGARSDWDGLANTRAMAEGGSELARHILDLEIEGHRDLYLPARHELRMIWLVAPFLIVKDWHWSSTQSSAGDAWCQYFGNGYQDTSSKGIKLRARAVRRFSIIQ